MGGFLLVLAVAAQGSDLRVGVAVRDITPPVGTAVLGYYHERKATGTRDPLAVKALVFAQGPVRAALVVADLGAVCDDLGKEVRRRVRERVGIPETHVAVAATHTHTGPEYFFELREHLARPRPGSYAERLIEETVAAVADAAAGARPGVLRVGKAPQEPQISFCRRDGGGVVDPDVGVLLVGEPPAAALVNFAIHLDTVGGDKWSADFPWALQEFLRPERGKDFVSIFANGCCGDLNHVNRATRQRNDTVSLGRALAATVKAARPEVLSKPSLAVRHAVVRAPLQETTAADLAWAKELFAQVQKGKKLTAKDMDVVKAYKLLYLEDLRTGSLDPDTRKNMRLCAPASLSKGGDRLPLEVQAIRLGAETAIVALPGEIFVELGLALKKASPFKNTFVVELSNAIECRYVPTREAYARGGYEVVNSVLQPGGGEMLVEAALRLLRELK